MSISGDLPAQLRSEAARQIIKTSLSQHRIKSTIDKLVSDTAANPPGDHETFVDKVMTVFGQAYQDTCSMLVEIKNGLQSVAAAAAGSQAPTGALGHINEVEEKIITIENDLYALDNEVNILIGGESKDNFLELFGKATTDILTTQENAKQALDDLKSTLLPI